MGDRTLKEQIGKRHPFDTTAQETHVNLLRTASNLMGPFHALFKQHKLTDASFNTLRILRGHHSEGELEGVRASLIGREMVVRVPDVTRIVDRLVTMGLAERRACSTDRRVVHVGITELGLELLRRLDGPVNDLHQQTLGHMSERELEQLNTLLEKARASVEDSEESDHAP